MPRAIDAVPDLRDIVAPIEISAFLSDYWESKPLVIRRKTAGYYARLLSLPDVVQFLTSAELRQSDLRLVRDGAPLPVDTYTRPVPWTDGTIDRVVNADTVFAEYHARATVILEALQRKWKPLTLLCRNLETFFHQGVQANVYLTPRNARGFAAHYDTHDVFVLQTAGSKHWRVYRPLVELPLASQPCLSETEIKEQIGQPIHEFDLEDGDGLYLPRGYVHEAAAATEVSLHITIGVIAVTWAEALSQALVSLSARDLRFRRSLPVGFGHPDRTDLMATAKQLGHLFTSLQESTDVEQLLAQMFDRFVATRLPILDGHFENLDRLNDITLKTRVRKRPGLLSSLRVEDGCVSIAFHSKKVTFPSRIAPVLRFIDRGHECTPALLPGDLDREGRLVLVRRLVKEGYLTTTIGRSTPS